MEPSLKNIVIYVIVMGNLFFPNLTMDEMKQQISKIVNQSLENKFQKWLTKKVLCLQLKTLKRWK